MFAHRSLIIFVAALVFAARTVWFADPVSLAAMLVFLSAHYLDRFFGSERVESKAMNRIAFLEDEIKRVTADVGHIKLGSGLRNAR